MIFRYYAEIHFNIYFWNQNLWKKSLTPKNFHFRSPIFMNQDISKVPFLWINISVPNHNPNFYFLRYKSKSSIPAVVPGMSSGTNFIKNGATKGRPCPPGKDSEFYV